MILKTIRFLVKLFFTIFIKVDITGLENLPPGGFVVASNHLGRLDPAMIFYCFPRDDFIMPVAEKYEHHPIIGPIGNAIGAVWLDRFNPDIHALREIMKRMKSGKVLVIAPEGTRSKTEMMQDGKPGALHFSQRGQVCRLCRLPSLVPKIASLWTTSNTFAVHILSRGWANPLSCLPPNLGRTVNKRCVSKLTN